MSNEWKALEKGNIPSDILTGDYDFQCYECGMPEPYYGAVEDIINDLDIVRVEYRKANREKVKRMPFGKFWNDDKATGIWAYLMTVYEDDSMKYEDDTINDCWEHFEAGLPEAFKEKP